ncbi:MAG: AMP-binding protein, partial [Acidobacteria bacterium]|nr:AMP-binding protein [Acidobacteriota bacterium]
MLELPTDRPRTADQDMLAGDRSVLLPAELGHRLEALGRSRNATLFMVLLGAFQLLLARMTGKRRIPVGSPIAGRNHMATEPLIGFFVNTQVLCTDLSGDPTFHEVLDRAREVSLGAHGHQELPFEKLVEELAQDRDANHAPLFQVMFTLQNAADERLELPDLVLEPLEGDQRVSKFDMLFQVEQKERGLDLFVDYRRALFDATSMERLLAHYHHLLEAALATPKVRVSEVSFLTPGERHQLQVEWPAKRAPYPRDASLAELFAEQVRRQPAATALLWQGRETSYGELDEAAEALRRRLLGRGLAAEERIGLCLERGPSMVVATLAVIKAGGAYVPLDPDYPAERLEFMARDAGLSVVLTEASLASRLTLPEGVETLLLDGGGEVTASSPPSDVSSASPPPAGGGSLAYVMYTSGSTGQPKGIAIPQRAVSRLVLGTDYVDLGPGDRVAQMASTSFDA